MEPLILLGGGGHCISCIDVIEKEAKFSISGILDPKIRLNEDIQGYTCLGDDRALPSLVAKINNVLITIGQIESPDPRIRLFHTIQKIGAKTPTVISPLAYVSERSFVCAGSIVLHGAIVNANAVVGENCIVNSHALIEHEVNIESHCHISTGARVNGGGAIGMGSFVGSGAVIRDNVVVGERCVVAAGTVVTRDVPDGTVCKGLF